MKFEEWIKNKHIPFKPNGLNGNYDDFKPLSKIIENTRVVAIGENSHFIKEFFLLRHNLLQFFIEELGFTTFAFEFGFAESQFINNWIHGQGAEDEISKYLTHFYYPKELIYTFHWLREYNRVAKNKITFLGIDIPRNGGSYFPNIEIVYDFFKTADKEALHIIDNAINIAKKIDYFSTSQAALKLHELTDSEKYQLTYQIARAKVRLEAMAPFHIEKYGKKKYETILHLINGIEYLDYNIQAMNGFISGFGLQGDMGAKDKYMADSVLWHLNNLDMEHKIIVVAHNAHIQKTPILYDGFLSCLPMGQRLKDAIGADYMSLGITSYIGNTAALYPEADTKYGFRVDNFQLLQPIEGSIEKALHDCGITNSFVSFKSIPENVKPLPNMIRFDSIYMETILEKAFDGIFQIEKSTVSEVIYD